MNVWIDCYAPLVGRIFMGGFFLWNGIQAALNLPAATAIFATHGVSSGVYWAMLSIAIEVIAGIAVIVGLWIRPAALLLAMYLLVQSALLTNFGNDAELNLFVLNLGLVGGLLYIAANGAGSWTLKRNR